MITCRIIGGLGNILFQISATESLSIKNNDQCYFDLELHSSSPRPQAPASDYNDNILRHIKKEKFKDTGIWYKYDPLVFQTIPYRPNLILHGYYQSEKYFKEYREHILNLFTPREEDLKHIVYKVSDIRERNSIHVRRGDYIKLTHIHKLCNMEYYKKGIDILGKHQKYVVFSDDINWCRENFSDIDVVFFNDKDYLEMYAMSLCKNHIIANSSFSWWGAWLNTKVDKTVICPKEWFGAGYRGGYDDIYCEGWVKV
jgi:hypothetical protein